MLDQRDTHPAWSDAGALAGAVVLIVGDLMLDYFVYGGVERISAEAPVPVLRAIETTRMLGGAGNVAANVRSLGGEARLVAALGADRDADEVEQLCTDIGIDAGWLVRTADRRTTVKTRMVAQRQQVLRLDSETVGPLSDAGCDAVEAAFLRALVGAQVVVLSDYGKGVLAGRMAELFIRLGRQAGLPVVVDPKGSDYARYRGASYITPNLKELAEATQLPVDTDEAVVAAARTLIARNDLTAVIATRSEKGLSIVEQADVAHVPTHAQEVFDVSGAGDTVVAGLALGLAAGMPVNRAAALANVAAGIAVAKFGTAQVTAEELTDALRQGGAVSPDGASRGEDAERTIKQWRRKGLRIGFTNGCFDLLHPGHVVILGEARKLCDRLIVGLNGDASVSRLKGPTRPINDERSRAIVLAALRSVDMVLLFHEDTPEALIHTVRPDVLIKGADYTIERVVGADFVQSYGGEVHLVDLVANQSTTAIARRIASAL